MGNFELKLLPEAQSAINFLEAEMAGGDPWRRATRQRIITEESKEQADNKKNHNLDLVIKVSVPDWKVMAFSTEPDGQLVWEHQVSRGTENVRLLRARIEAELVAVKSRSSPWYQMTRLVAVLHSHRLCLAGGRGPSHPHQPV